MLSPWNKSHEKPRQYIEKQRHYFADKYLCNQSYGFSSSHAGMWELDHKEGWVPKNWCFWTVVRSRLLRVPWTAKKSNQSSLKEISPEYSLEGLMMKLKLQYFGQLMRRNDSFEKTLGGRGILRWWRNRMGRPLSPPQIHQKNISMPSKFYKTTSECWQRTSGTQKSRLLSSKTGRKKYIRQKNRQRR